MPTKRSDKIQLWRGVWRQARPFLLGTLPVVDLPSRYRVRRLAVSLVECDPWPGMAATGEDAAQLAILRLRRLQRETRCAVRGRHAEAATLLARASIETLITGLYCLHEQDAVARLQAETNIMITNIMITTPPDMPGQTTSRKVGESHDNLAVDKIHASRSEASSELRLFCHKDRRRIWL